MNPLIDIFSSKYQFSIKYFEIFFKKKLFFTIIIVGIFKIRSENLTNNKTFLFRYSIVNLSKLM